MTQVPPKIVLVDAGVLAPFAKMLQQLGLSVTTTADFEQAGAVAAASPLVILYFDPAQTPRPSQFDVRLRNAGTATLLVAIPRPAEAPEPATGWHLALDWPLPEPALKAAIAEHLDQARQRRVLFEIGTRFAKGLHDLRTPLGGIKGYASTLNLHWDRMPEPDRREAIQIIESEVDRVTDLLEELTNVERALRRGEWQG